MMSAVFQSCQLCQLIFEIIVPMNYSFWTPNDYAKHDFWDNYKNEQPLLIDT